MIAKQAQHDEHGAVWFCWVSLLADLVHADPANPHIDRWVPSMDAAQQAACFRVHAQGISKTRNKLSWPSCVSDEVDVVHYHMLKG